MQLAGPEDLTITQAAAVFSEGAKRPLQLQVAVIDSHVVGGRIRIGVLQGQEDFQLAISIRVRIEENVVEFSKLRCDL